FEVILGCCGKCKEVRWTDGWRGELRGSCGLGGRFAVLAEGAKGAVALGGGFRDTPEEEGEEAGFVD
ncbi:MAG TPA: hypothetical protein PLZ95_14370, partial [Bryobacteraceae bacterium]|nr:hypothetical protein [Bryobacteraceae bacterium]